MPAPKKLHGDPVVKEETIRKSIDKITSGHVDTQRRMGNTLPDVVAAQEFAKDVTRQVVVDHEERHSKFIPPRTEEQQPALPPDRLSRGDVGPDDTVIQRGVGSAEFARDGAVSGNVQRRKPRTPEDPRLRARLDVLGRLPEWHSRLMAAALEGETYAKKLGVHDEAGRMSIVADFVINVVEQSNQTLGDWRLPPTPALAKIMVSGRT